AGRLATDPPNTLAQGEAHLFDGTGSQTGGGAWGRHSQMTIDPVDDCTFWYTNEYYAAMSTFNWRTRIGSFKFTQCDGSVTPTPTATATATATSTTTPIPTPSPSSTPSPSPSPTPAAQALNLSTRMRVETGDNVGIGGFIITGSAPKPVILRGIGPSLPVT